MITMVSWNIAWSLQAVEELLALDATSWRSSSRWAWVPWNNCAALGASLR